MKKNIRRGLALCLALVLAFTVPVSASAASRLVTRNGTTYMMYLNKLWRSDVIIPYYDTISVEHVQGMPTQISYSGVIDFEYHMDCDTIPPWCLQNVEEMMLEEDLFYSAGSAGGTYINDVFVIDPDQPSGTYWLCVRVWCYRAEWGFSEDLMLTSAQNTARSVPDGGTFYHVPMRGSGMGKWTVELRIP